MKLTPKQELFITEYLVDLNATAAYTRAYGATGKTAEVNGCKLLRNAKVKEIIDERMQQRAKDTGITANYVLSSLKTVAERCMQAEQVIIKGKPTGQYVFDSMGANKALELLGKHLKLFTDKTEVSGSLGVQIVDDIE